MLTKYYPGNYDTIVLVRLSAEGLENDQEPADAILSAYVLAFRERIFKCKTILERIFGPFNQSVRALVFESQAF